MIMMLKRNDHLILYYLIENTHLNIFIQYLDEY